jgi:heme/copper-type cytochrome/quinol oxidase subunit 2
MEREHNMILSNSKWGLLLTVFVPLAVVSVLSFIVGHAFGQESSSQPQQILDRRVEIWALFYRGMVAAFVVGAVVQGSIIYVAWRFRESNKKNMPREPAGGVHR